MSNNGHQYKVFTCLILIISILILSVQNSVYSVASTLPIKMKFIAGGSMHSASVGIDGSVWTWGDNYYGQLGDGSKISKSIPTKVKGLSGFKSVACGANHTLALKEDGTVWAWGQNLCRQLGNGAKNSTESNPVKVIGLNNIKSIAGGYNHSIALKSDGTVWTWGRNSENQLGRKTPYYYTGNPGVIESLTGVIEIASLGDYTAALKNDGTVWICGKVCGSADTITQAEGLTDITEISAMDNNVAALKRDGTVYLFKFTAYGNELKKVVGLEDIKSISCGQYQLNAIKNDGSLWRIGISYSTFGVITRADPEFGDPIRINNIDNVRTMASGYNHTIILKNDGTVWAIGNNRSGQLGNGIIALSSKPFRVSGLDKIKDINACSSQSMALNDKGVVFVWGEDENNESEGDGYISTPKEVTDLVDTKALASNSGTYAVLKKDGTVWCWGANVDNTKKIEGLSKVIALYGGDNYCFQYIALRSGGDVWEWASNGNVVRPQRVNGISNVTAISKGAYHNLALKKDGTVWSWRNTVFYADESKIEKQEPIKVSMLSNVVAITASETTSLALKKDGTVWTWDTDNDGNLTKKPPQKIKGLSGVIAISGDSTALKKDGTLWNWGNNQYGQLGDGTFVNKLTPVKVLGLKNIVSISSGQFHSLALDKNGTVWAWGLNDSGQLGNGVVLYEDEFVQCLIK